MGCISNVEGIIASRNRQQASLSVTKWCHCGGQKGTRLNHLNPST